MTYSMKSKNKLEGDSNFRAWKTRIDLILSKNKVLDIVKGKIVEPKFEEGKEKEPQNIAVMDKLKENNINAMSIIVDSVKYHLIPYISHNESSKKMCDSLTNLFSTISIRQVMGLKNELCKMKMNDDNSITSYLVIISQLRDQLQDFKEIISKKELVNIVLNGLPKTWEAFSASMNIRKEYPKRNTMINLSQHSSIISEIRKKKPNQEKDMSKIQCFNCRKPLS
jgi:hypothetical protein